MEQYLTILEESLQKKCRLLDELSKLNEEQREKLSGENVELDAFDSYIDAKDGIIKELQLLDSGFEKIYARIAEELNEKKADYADCIRRLQELIRSVTEKSTAVQAQEQRNKSLIEGYFAGRRTEIKEGRRSSQVAMQYYKTQSSGGVYTSRFMDDKK